MSVIPVIIIGLLYIPLIVVSIVCLVLFIKLALRGIKALDIYIEQNSDGMSE